MNLGAPLLGLAKYIYIRESGHFSIVNREVMTVMTVMTLVVRENQGRTA